MLTHIQIYVHLSEHALATHIQLHRYIIRDKIKCELNCCIYTNIAVSFTLAHTRTGLSGKRQHIRKDVAAASGIFIAYECLDVLCVCVCIAGCFPLLTYIYLCIYTQINIYV